MTEQQQVKWEDLDPVTKGFVLICVVGLLGVMGYFLTRKPDPVASGQCAQYAFDGATLRDFKGECRACCDQFHESASIGEGQGFNNPRSCGCMK